MTWILGCSWVSFISSPFSCPSLTKYMRSHTSPAISPPNSYRVNRLSALSQAHSSQSDTPANRRKCGAGAGSVGEETERCIPIFQHVLLLCHRFVILQCRHRAQSTFQHVWCHAEFRRPRPGITIRRRPPVYQSRQQWDAGRVYFISAPTSDIGIRFRLLLLPSILFLYPFLQSPPPTGPSEVTSLRNVYHSFCSDFANPLPTPTHPGLINSRHPSPPATRMERVGEPVGRGC